MTKGKWIDAEEDRAKLCETAFQNGGPRVYVFEDGWKHIPSVQSAKATIGLAFEGQVVYARRKMGQRWVWRKFQTEE